jgi:hypothetical protein
MMDPQSKATLDAILATEPAALTDADKDFLRARRSYLSEEHRAVYADVLAEQSEAESSEESQADSEPKAPKKAKK